MKNSLLFLALLSALALPAETFAGLAGLHVPAALNGENTLALFATAFVLLIVIADYRPRFSILPRATGRKPAIAPVVLEVTVSRSNAYGVRRPRSARNRVAL